MHYRGGNQIIFPKGDSYAVNLGENKLIPPSVVHVLIQQRIVLTAVELWPRDIERCSVKSHRFRGGSSSARDRQLR